MEQLTGMDAAFLYMERPNAPLHIGGLAIYDPSTAPGGSMRFKEIIQFTEERMHLARTFRQRLVRVPLGVDHPYWIEDPNFDIEYHIRHIALPAPGDWRQLCIVASRIYSRPLDMDRPLWEYTVIEGLDNVAGVPKGSYAILSKIHHCAIDGMSGIDMMNAVHTLSPNDFDVVPPKSPWVPDKIPSGAELLARAQVNNVRQPMRLANVAVKSTPSVAKALRNMARGSVKAPSNRVPVTRFSKKVSPHRIIENRSFKLNDIREIKSRQPGATVNDAVLAIVGGALRNYLRSKNDLPDESLIAMAPVSTRADNEKDTMGNQVSAMSIALGTHLKDPMERMAFTHDTATAQKAFTHAIGARQLTDYAKYSPALLSGLAARLSGQFGINPPFNTVVTNVPGPQVPLYSGGSKMVANFGIGCPVDGMGIFHPIGSYCGEVTISVTACREMLPDPEFYAECIGEAFEELQATAIKRPGLAAKPAAKKAPAPKRKAAARKKSTGRVPRAAVAKAKTGRKKRPGKPAGAART